MILKLINRNGRVVWVANWNELFKIDIEHESGRGINYPDPESTFLSAFCALNDNPSCQFDGSHVSKFLAYCEQHIDWMCPALKKKFETQ